MSPSTRKLVPAHTTSSTHQTQDATPSAGGLTNSLNSEPVPQPHDQAPTPAADAATATHNSQPDLSKPGQVWWKPDFSYAQVCYPKKGDRLIMISVSACGHDIGKTQAVADSILHALQSGESTDKANLLKLKEKFMQENNVVRG